MYYFCTIPTTKTTTRTCTVSALSQETGNRAQADFFFPGARESILSHAALSYFGVLEDCFLICAQ